MPQPKFELPPQYDPHDVEAPLYRRWQERGVFRPRPDGEPYVIVIPPPNVTAILHVGHGLNNIIQDVLIRFERMRGRAAEWLPGTDHAGIAESTGARTASPPPRTKRASPWKPAGTSTTSSTPWPTARAPSRWRRRAPRPCSATRRWRCTRTTRAAAPISGRRSACRSW